MSIKPRNAVNGNLNIIVFDDEETPSKRKSKAYPYRDDEEDHENERMVTCRNLYPRQDYNKLLHKYQEENTLFRDSHFASDNSVLSSSMQRWESIDWLRPKDICKRMKCSSPKMVSNERNRFDINQGALGDCWFLAALAQLAEKDTYFNRVVPIHQDFNKDYVGLFRFRFFRYRKVLITFSIKFF